MPAKVRVGSKVSSNRSCHGKWLEKEPHKKRRQKERLFGVVVRSTVDGKWEVRWDNGLLEAMLTGSVRREGDPDEDSLALVREIMGVRR